MAVMAFLLFSCLCTFFLKQHVKVSALEICANFEFPNLPNKHLAGKEYTSINIPFILRNVTCGSTDLVYVQVYKNMSRQCGYSYSLKNGSCFIVSRVSSCQCLSTGLQSLSRNLSLSDSTVWQWTASNEHLQIIASAEITLNITRPPEFTEKRHLIFTAVSGYNTSIDFPFRTHTLDILECLLSRHLEGSSTATYITHACSVDSSNNATNQESDVIQQPHQWKCHCGLSGTPPNLNLTVRVQGVTLIDNGPWRVTVSNPVGSDSLYFSLRISKAISRITNLTVNGVQGQGPHFVLKNQIVHVTCSWENGEFPGAVRLLGNHGNTLLSKSGQHDKTMTHQFSTVLCKDAGVIRCEADGSVRNMSTVLLVECPPEFTNLTLLTITTVSGRSASINAPVRTHTSDITECLLSRYREEIHGASYTSQICDIRRKSVSDNATDVSKDTLRGKCWCGLNGTVPDLTLNVQIWTVSAIDKGHWHVTVSNRAGSGTLNISINVSNDLTDQRNEMAVSPLIPSVISGVIAVIAIATLLLAIYIINSRSKYSHLWTKRQEEAAPYTDLSSRPRSDQNVLADVDETNIYQLIMDEDIGESKLPKSDCPGNADSRSEDHVTSGGAITLNGRSGSDNYLHPVHVDINKSDNE